MKTSEELRARAANYRDLMRRVTDPRLIDALRTLAAEYDALADQLGSENGTGGDREDGHAQDGSGRSGSSTGS